MKRHKGERTERVILQKRVVTKDKFQKDVEDWDSDNTPIYAEFWERHGRESKKESLEITFQDVRCEIRYRQDLDPIYSTYKINTDFRIKRGKLIYRIASSIKENRSFLLLLLTEVNTDRENG